MLESMLGAEAIGVIILLAGILCEHSGGVGPRVDGAYIVAQKEKASRGICQSTGSLPAPYMDWSLSPF